MRKNNVIILSFILIFTVCCIVSYFVINSKKEVINNSDFKKIYDRKDSVKVYIKNLQYEESIEITSKDDIYNILDVLKYEKVKKVKVGDEVLGGNYSIVFVLEDKENVINIFDTQININGKSYYTENNVKAKTKDIVEKYGKNLVNN